MASIGLLVAKFLNRYQAAIAPYLWALKRDNGTPVSVEPVFLVGDCPAALTSGLLLYRKSDSTYAKCDPADPAKMPAVAYLDSLLTSTSFAGRPISSICEVLVGTTLTPGAVYVVGTDGFLAKEGDATFPTKGLRQVIGMAVDAQYLRFEPALAGLSSAPAGMTGGYADSATILTNSSTLTLLDTQSIPLNYFKAGRMYALEGTIKHVAGVSSSTFTATLKIGSQVLVVTGAFNVADAGDQTQIGCQFLVRSVGVSGTMVLMHSYARCSAASGSTGPASGVITLDTTVANDATIYGQYSAVSSADSAMVQALTIRQLT